ncbi:unnamed protein product [Ranitomeya imitator]|uniref:Uncharacterized protein n=1 Tax=Ranitomeya imitator TaxID=111125 RepID=A0ABN9M843_9NEOB|nr:unnamed protein product [Ranitomeya imitator]
MLPVNVPVLDFLSICFAGSSGTQGVYLRAVSSSEGLQVDYQDNKIFQQPVLMGEEISAIRYRFNSPINKPTQRVQMQHVVCKRLSDGSSVPNDMCETQVKIQEKQRLCNTEPCPPEWAIGSWSECSRSCNSGVRTRSVICQRRVSSGDEKSLDDSNCPIPRPTMLEPCNTKECPPEWVALDWSEVPK